MGQMRKRKLPLDINQCLGALAGKIEGRPIIKYVYSKPTYFIQHNGVVGSRHERIGCILAVKINGTVRVGFSKVRKGMDNFRRDAAISYASLQILTGNNKRYPFGFEQSYQNLMRRALCYFKDSIRVEILDRDCCLNISYKDARLSIGLDK